MLAHDISDYSAIPSLKDPSSALLEKWLIYVQYSCDDLWSPFRVNEFWKGVHACFPNLTAIAMQTLWTPVASVDVERSYSQYKHILNDRRESLTE